MKKFASRVFLLLFGVILSVAILEVGVRMIGIKPATYLRKFSEFDQVLGWRKSPNIEGHFQRGDVRIHEKLNSKGLRSPEYPYPKPEGTRRILVLGDSFTEGYDVEVEDLFTTILEDRLRKSLPGNFEVVNAGTGGYSTDQEYLFYVTEGFKYEPDVVILMIYCTNDVYYNVLSRYGNYPKPLLAITDTGLAPINLPLQAPPQSEGVKDLARNLALYQFILNQVLPSMPALTRLMASWGLVSQETAELTTTTREAPLSFGIFRRQPSATIAQAWTITDSILSALRQVTLKHGSDFVVFSIPDKFQVYQDSWEITQEKYSVSDSIWDRKAPERRLSNLSKTLDFEFVNFADSLTHRNLSMKLYNGVHWNKDGNEVVAEVLFNVMRGHFSDSTESDVSGP